MTEEEAYTLKVGDVVLVRARVTNKVVSAVSLETDDSAPVSFIADFSAVHSVVEIAQ